MINVVPAELGLIKSGHATRKRTNDPGSPH
jgi:hypothetical protein